MPRRQRRRHRPPTPTPTPTLTLPPTLTRRRLSGPTVADAATAVAELLELRTSCFATLDLACLDQVVQPGSAIEAADRAAMVAARDGEGPVPDEFDLGAIAVSADMGAAVLVTVPFATAEREPASLLVMRGEAGWRLRELFD